jgi:site-specific DNA-methyltransferase (cytosine-N4-specific)
MFVGRIEDALEQAPVRTLKGKVNLIFTSPPFPLVFKKSYGNKSGDEYIAWLRDLSPRLTKLLSDDGSIVIEIGNAWNQGLPTMSTLPLRSLLEFQEAAGLHLCQHIVCHNPARLPGPAQWVNVERIRLKDSFTHLWWLSPSIRPKADNRQVLLPYSDDMKRLLQTRRFNRGARPSGHVVRDQGFLRDHGGAISPNVIDFADPASVPHALLTMANTARDADYTSYCRDRGLTPHPARMRLELAMFFIALLTDPGDLVLDPFAGSNTTGAAAEALRRRWIAVEADDGFARGSQARFQSPTTEKGAA